MLIAHDTNGLPVEAARDLPAGAFSCPACDGSMLLKRGQVKVPHFAHMPGTECWSEAESVSHLRSKNLLAEKFRQLGYDVQLEETYRDQGRRVDVAVTIPAWDRGSRVAVEVQDSAIDVETMKARTRIDRSLGFIGTLWVFTDKRAKVLLDVTGADIEVRIPNEMLWVDHRYRQGVFVLDLDAAAVWNIELGPPHVRISEWYDGDGYGQSSAYVPRTIRCPIRHAADFTLTSTPGRYPNEWAVVFARRRL
ncbi:competence protein CoiA family protein [Streptosporangium canum]|uniref:competence protein CoiA n=1 Tax=Streptosporangium canum TaxID=324952 RepID=UPI00343B72EC